MGPGQGIWALWVLIPLAAALGSFSNVVVARLPRGESVVRPGSKCPHCGTAIRPWNNIPVVAYLRLGGRCADCGSRISFRYLMVEILTPAAACLLFFGAESWHQGLALFVFFFLLMILSLIDIENMILPDVLTYALGFFGLLLALSPWHFQSIDLIASCAGIGAGATLVYLLASAIPDGMGLGDVKLAGALGAWLGPVHIWQGLLWAFVLGGALAALLLLMGRRKRRDHIPFGPFLCLGALGMVLAPLFA